MKFTMTKIAAGLALAFVASGAHALSVTGMTLADTIDSNTNSAINVPVVNGAFTATGGPGAGPDGLGTDGASGAFRFGPINLDTYAGANAFYGDVGGGVINLAGSAPGSFTTGFLFTGAAFQPFNPGPIVMSTSAAADAAAVGTVLAGSNLTVSSLPFAGFFTANNYTFALSPDAGTLVVNNLIKTGANSYAYRLSFSHDITSTEDPSGQYSPFTARWVLEGTISTAAAAPVPEASTYGMMLAGLGLVGAAVSRRRRFIK